MVFMNVLIILVGFFLGSVLQQLFASLIQGNIASNSLAHALNFLVPILTVLLLPISGLFGWSIVVAMIVYSVALSIMMGEGEPASVGIVSPLESDEID